MTAPSPSPDAASASAAPTWATRVLHDDEDVCLELTARTPPADTVAVTFDPIMVNVGQPAYAGEFLRRCGADTLAVRKKHEHFYQPFSREQFLEITEPHLRHYRRRLAYGSSLGAYAVLYYCQQGYETVIASSPRVSAHPRFGIDFWQSRVAFQHRAFDPEHPAGSGAVVFYDPHDKQDRPFVEQEIAPAWPKAEVVPVPYAGHPVNQFLAEIGFIAPYVRAVVADTPRPSLDRRRLKARSATYHQVLAMGCLAHGKLAWAQRLAERALEMSPRLIIAKRTLGEVLLAMNRLDDAEPLLRDFITHHPLDGSAVTALKRLLSRRAEACRAGRLPAAAPARAAQATAAAAPEPETAHASRPLASRPARVAHPLPQVATRRLKRSAFKLLSGTGLTVSREDIVWCYRHLLGREPESEEAIQAHGRFFSFKALVECFVASPEYAGRSSAVAYAGTPPAGAQAPVSAQAFRQAIEEHLDGGPVSKGLREYIEMHFERLLDTLNLVHRLLPRGGTMLDYSAMGFFSHAVGRLVDGVTQVNVSGVNFELDDYAERYGTARFDLCLNTEVLEHLLFDPSQMFACINRMLKPGGHLVVSTPNAVSMANAVRLLNGSAPSLWNQLNATSKQYFERHNRDWTPFEVATLLQEHGFEVLEAFTKDYYESTRKILAHNQDKCQFVQRHSTHQHLGDTMFVVARKQREVSQPVRNSWLYVLPAAA